jgi:hypothetical protein
VLIHLRKWLRRARGNLSTAALTALLIAAFAAYAGAIVLLAHSLPGGNDEDGQKGGLSSPSGGHVGPPGGGDRAAIPRFPASDYRQSRFPKLGGEPLIGVNYTHYAFRHCDFAGTGILAYYQEPGVAEKVHAQLFRMRKSGVAAIRTVIWHMTDAAGQYWGPIPSAGGRLREPYRTNLIRYLTEIRKFGFARFTVSFVPQQTNNPLLPIFKRAKFWENWRFIETVRALVKRYGPAKTRIDLLSEGAPTAVPTDWSPVPRQTSAYLRKLYRLYVSHFGSRDVTVSAIASEPVGVADRLRNLVQILKSTNEPLPRWYDVHIPYFATGAASALQKIDSALDAEGQGQALVIGETAYDNPGVATSIKSFLQSSSRPIDEISPWYLRRLKGCQVPPPYRPGAYGSELAGLVKR